MGIRRERRVGRVDARRGKRPHEHPFADRLEQTRERICTGLRGT
jgi:hypothetical protein